ncbi:unnamed protein product [Brachionus calyciflorus]|uniref:Uncharacterized protein n=1 Tax=Brachionus calyciflorus TaxID=104777 RepID=A0A813M5S2_9BILA|nr:unnamed protein product [Brachionus calyciflorus]
MDKKIEESKLCKKYLSPRIQIEENHAKNLFIENLKRINSKKKINNLVNVTKVNDYDALIYSLTSMIESEKFDEVYFPQGEKMPLNNSYCIKEDTSYPKETYFYTQIDSEITCFSCNGRNQRRLRKNFSCTDCNECSNLYERCDFCVMNLENTHLGNLEENTCSLCNGKGKLKKYKRTTTAQDYLYDVWIKCPDKDIPLKNLLNAKGISIVKETDSKILKPIDHFPDEELSQVSSTFILSHKEKVQKKKIYKLINQTHQLTSVSVACFNANFQNKKRPVKFYIMGGSSIIFIPHENDQCIIS